MLLPPLYQQIFSNSPISACILSPSADPVILDVNDAFLEGAAQARDRLVGRPLFEVFSADPDDPQDTGVQALRTSLSRAVETGQPQPLPTQRYPVRIVGPDGAEHFVERYWNAVNTPIFGDDGKLLCIHHVAIEVTEQKRAEEALRVSEQRALTAARQAQAESAGLEAVLHAVSVGIMMSGVDSRVLHVNPEHDRLWGRTGLHEGQMLDFGEWKGWWADGSARHGNPVRPDEWPLARALRGLETAHQLIEIETFAQPCVRRIVLCSGTPIRDADGTVTAGVVSLMDLTDRLRAEGALREADRRKDEFLAMLAHELRNPLAPILAAASLLGHGMLDGERVRQASTIISRQVRHMTGLVDDLLDVSRVTRGQIVLDRSRIDVQRIVFEAVEQVLPLVQSRRHELVVNAPPEPVQVHGDYKRLVQVVANLLNNAAKYTPEGGRIELDAGAVDGHVRISVNDNGIGMSPELIARAFELFSQAERGADRAQGGLGIGLALVKSLVELHGGTVSATSEARGQGSRFTVALPRADLDAGPDAGAGPAPVDASCRSLQVLVVDDNEDAATMLALVLQALGNEVVVENNPFTALQTARRLRPDVCILDIGLPDMDGNELAQRLRADPATAQATLIAVTGYGQAEDRKRAFAAGFDRHFVKPVSGSDIAAVLCEAARGEGRVAPPQCPARV
jgi:PAS domain S-box-containing protein